MEKMNIIYLITKFEDGDGTTSGLTSQIRIDKEVLNNYLIVAKIINTSNCTYNIASIKNKKLISDFLKKGNICIHYFKGASSNILMDMIALVGKQVPIIATICQVPSYHNLWLTPFELKNIWHFVFIDKAAYNNKLINFLPNKVKSQIYCSGFNIYKDYSNVPKREPDGKIVYGRGSSSIKCPKDMIDLFNKIDVPNKVFRIVGIEEDSWIREEAKKYSNVEVYGMLPGNEWIEMCNSFDVFLYQIPKDCHSSIDGTLGLAMLLGKPVVYMGSEAPKERFHDNKNGFVANNADEFVEYATKLGKDSMLRKKIGEKGRFSTMRDFTPEERTKSYMEIYKSLVHYQFKIPALYWLEFFLKNKNQAKQYLFGIMRFSFPKTYNFYNKYLK